MTEKWQKHIASLPTEKILSIGYNIINFFNTASRFDGGRMFGWDWPTMAMIEPKTVQFFNMLKQEYNTRFPKRKNESVALPHQ